MTDAAQPDRFGFLHIDLNSFFASVEQQIHPEYRGKPLGVCGTMADTGALIAASYEAKALGINTLTKVGEAKRLCPDIILVNGSHSVYSEYSHKICRRGRALLPRRAHPFDRRDGLRAAGPRARAPHRPPHRA